MSTTVSILGNTGREVKLRYSEKGTAVATFPIASNSYKNGPGGRVKTTHWYNVTAFGKVAETLASNVRKGTHLLVQGRLGFKPWLTKDGQPRAGAEVILQSYDFADGAKTDNGQEAGSPEPEMLPEPAQNDENSAVDDPFDDQF